MYYRAKKTPWGRPQPKIKTWAEVSTPCTALYHIKYWQQKNGDHFNFSPSTPLVWPIPDPSFFKPSP